MPGVASSQQSSGTTTSQLPHSLAASQRLHYNATAPPRTAQSGYVGVYRVAGRSKFLAQVTCQGHTINLGYFTDAKQAAETYDCASLLLRGRGARINCPAAAYSDQEFQVVAELLYSKGYDIDAIVEQRAYADAGMYGGQAGGKATGQKRPREEYGGAECSHQNAAARDQTRGRPRQRPPDEPARPPPRAGFKHVPVNGGSAALAARRVLSLSTGKKLPAGTRSLHVSTMGLPGLLRPGAVGPGLQVRNVPEAQLPNPARLPSRNVLEAPLPYSTRQVPEVLRLQRPRPPGIGPPPAKRARVRLQDLVSQPADALHLPGRTAEPLQGSARGPGRPPRPPAAAAVAAAAPGQSRRQLLRAGHAEDPLASPPGGEWQPRPIRAWPRPLLSCVPPWQRPQAPPTSSPSLIQRLAHGAQLQQQLLEGCGQPQERPVGPPPFSPPAAGGVKSMVAASLPGAARRLPQLPDMLPGGLAGLANTLADGHAPSWLLSYQFSQVFGRVARAADVPVSRVVLAVSTLFGQHRWHPLAPMYAGMQQACKRDDVEGVRQLLEAMMSMAAEPAQGVQQAALE